MSKPSGIEKEVKKKGPFIGMVSILFTCLSIEATKKLGPYYRIILVSQFVGTDNIHISLFSRSLRGIRKAKTAAIK